MFETLPGWHTTIVPWYTTHPALLAFLALFVCVLVTIKKFLGLENRIVVCLLKALTFALVILGAIGSLYYLANVLILHQAGMFQFLDGLASSWFFKLFASVCTQLFWFKKVRSNFSMTFGLCLIVFLFVGLSFFVNPY